MPRILVIDDDKDYLAMIRAFLSESEYETSLLALGDNALEEIRRFNPDLVILDILMPGIMGGSVYQAIRNTFDHALPVIVVTGTDIRIKGVNDPFLTYLRKPVDLDILLKTIQKFAG